MPDDNDAALLELVHPHSWRNPTPAEIYDLVVLGGGTAGLVSAMGAVGLGARVALVERHMLGDDCLNTGCVPSKALVRSARAAGELSRAGSLGITVERTAVDFAKVMGRMRQRRAAIAVNDSAVRLQRAGVDVFFGDARFVDGSHVVVDDKRLKFHRAVIATGSRPKVPAVPGLEAVRYLTNETIFSLTALPRRLLVIGAGPIGCEMSQAFARFGSVVTLLGKSPRPLPREDADAGTIVQRQLERDGVRCEMAARLVRVEQSESGKRVWFSQEGSEDGFHEADEILVAAGRVPNVEGLALETAGVATGPSGVAVDDRLRTSNPRIYASGDVCSAFKFTHAADAQSRIVVQNALFFGRRKASALVIPWVTYTDPQVAHVGVSLAEADRRERRLSTITIPLVDIDRAVVDDDAEGFVRVHHERGRLRGCTVVASEAGEMIGEVTYAMTQRGTLASLSSTVHPYPTVSEAFRKAGDAYRRHALTPGIRVWLERYFRWTR